MVAGPIRTSRCRHLIAINARARRDLRGRGRRPGARVTPRRGRLYEHRCPLDAYQQISHAAEELGGQSFTIHSLLAYERAAGRDVTFTNVAVALAFLRERSVLDVRRRRNDAATDAVHLDAMTEYHALAAKA